MNIFCFHLILLHIKLKYLLGFRLTSFKRGGGGGGGMVESGNGLLNSGLFPQPYNMVTSWEDLHFFLILFLNLHGPSLANRGS